MVKDYDVLVVGEINPDLILQGGDVTPRFGQQENLVENASLTIGSSAAIVACGAATLGLRTLFMGVVGDDLFGHFMLDAMRDKGVDTSYCRVKTELATGISVILSQKTDRAILTYSGSISKLNIQDLDLTVLPNVRHLHLSSFFLLDDLRPDVPKLFKLARRQSLTTSLDTNWDPAETWDISEVIAYTDILLPNEAEALALSRSDTIEKAAASLSCQASIVAIKLGAEGGMVRQAEATFYAKSIQVEPVDTTGAGDSFDAGFLYGHLTGLSVEESLRAACICGSLSTRTLGGTGSQANLDDLTYYFQTS